MKSILLKTAKNPLGVSQKKPNRLSKFVLAVAIIFTKVYLLISCGTAFVITTMIIAPIGSICWLINKAFPGPPSLLKMLKETDHKRYAFTSS